MLPGVTVEVTSPQLIEKVRSTITDENGRYQIASLPVGIYKVTFTLDRICDGRALERRVDQRLHRAGQCGDEGRAADGNGDGCRSAGRSSTCRTPGSGRCSRATRSRTCRPRATSAI